jgi:hypothetical protein
MNPRLTAIFAESSKNEPQMGTDKLEALETGEIKVGQSTGCAHKRPTKT